MFDKQYRDSFRQIVVDMYKGKEVWLFHPNYENIVVSNLGKVKNVLTGHIYPVRLNDQGYCLVHICPVNKNRSESKLLHRMVAETFLNYLDCESYEVNHIIPDKQNNNLENLEWTTRQENLKHAKDNGLYKPLYGESNSNCRYSDKDCQDVRELRELGYSATEIAKAYGINGSSQIYRMIKRK